MNYCLVVKTKKQKKSVAYVCCPVLHSSSYPYGIWNGQRVVVFREQFCIYQIEWMYALQSLEFVCYVYNPTWHDTKTFKTFGYYCLVDELEWVNFFGSINIFFQQIIFTATTFYINYIFNGVKFLWRIFFRSFFLLKPL